MAGSHPAALTYSKGRKMAELKMIPGDVMKVVPLDNDISMTAALVRAILEKWASYEWTVQGFGMVRTKIANVGRIHVWDSRLRTPLVSDMHAHPWSLRSTVISGELINQRFCRDGEGMPYMHSRIATGEGGGLLGEPELVSMSGLTPEAYRSDDCYEQSADEIHRTIPQDGTVTLLERALGPPLQETSVYWPAGTDWVSAEPHKIEAWPLERTIKYALARWHSA